MTDVATVIVSVDEARRLTERIRLVAGNIADNVEKLRDLVQQAKDSDVHAVLGYASWTAYLKDVFGDEPLRLARDVRQELVAELAAQGMSTRAIAPIVGTSHMQVSRDLNSGVTDVTPAVSSRGPDVMPHLPPRSDDWTVPGLPVDPMTGEVGEAGDEDDRGEAVVVTETTVTEKTRTVTGLDGKTYTRQASAPRRGSILDEARNAGWQLRKAIERVERLVQDDRFGKNKAEIRAALQPHLDFAGEVFADL